MSKYFWILLTLATLIVFLPTVGTYFSQDDWVFLSHVYKQPFSSVFKHYPEAFYRPVGQQLFFFIGSRLFGLEAQGFHLFGLIIHLFNVWLLSKLLNIRDCDRRLKYFLLTFYAVNPAHFVALNWLTQINLEIAVAFSLLTILLWKRTIFSFFLFLGALLSHEIVVLLPVFMALESSKGPTSPRRGRVLLKSAMFLCFGVLVLIVKYLINPFSSQSDYSLSLDLPGLLATSKWYLLRAFVIPEGIRNFPIWLIILSLIPGLILILLFRQKLARGLGIYLLGVLPVLEFENHFLAGYAVFGIVLMIIELGKNKVVARKIFWVLSTIAIILFSASFTYFNYSNHWSTGRGTVSRQLTQEYTWADFNGKKEVLSRSKDFENNSEVYFASMIGKQFQVLDRGVSRGVFDTLFYRGNDMTTQFLPDAEFFKDRILAGKFPKWNPWIMAGMPYFLDPQNFLWYPPNYIFLLVQVEVGFLVLLIGHLALAGWGVKKVLGEFGIFGKLAVFGALMFILSPKLIGHIEEGNWTLVVAVSWLPMLYWALKKNKFWGTVISLAAIIINNLNIGYYSVLFVLFYFLTHLGQNRSLSAAIQERSLIALARRLLKILIISAILTTPRWLPLVLWGSQTVRANLREASLPVWSWTKIVKSLVFPLASGHPGLQNEEILYLGLVPLAVLILGVLGILGRLGKLGTMIRKGVSLLRQGDSLLWLIWLLFVFFVALNNKTPLFNLIKWLPGFSLLRITTRPWIFAPLALALAVPSMIRRIGDIRQIRGIWVSQKIVRPAALVLAILVLVEFIWFDWRIFSRREIVLDPVPKRFYRQMATEGIPVRAYCTTGCLDRLTAQRMEIALLGGNNPIQLLEFVDYLQRAGGYREAGYHPILPPYTVFNQRPQPNAELLGKTATKFVVSPYELTGNNFGLMDQEGNFRLYQNTVKISVKDHYFEVH